MKALENFEEYKDLIPANRHEMVRNLIELAYLEGQNLAMTESNATLDSLVKRLAP